MTCGSHARSPFAGFNGKQRSATRFLSLPRKQSVVPFRPGIASNTMSDFMISVMLVDRNRDDFFGL